MCVLALFIIFCLYVLDCLQLVDNFFSLCCSILGLQLHGTNNHHDLNLKDLLKLVNCHYMHGGFFAIYIVQSFLRGNI